MIRFFLVPCLILMLGIRMPMAEPMRTDGGSIEGAKGFGIGALVGGIVGGPVGALVGAAGGAIFAEQGAAKDRTIDELEAKLDARPVDIAVVESDAEQTRVALTDEVKAYAMALIKEIKKKNSNQLLLQWLERVEKSFKTE